MSAGSSGCHKAEKPVAEVPLTSASLLFSLPAEVRLEVYEYLLAPKSNEAVWDESGSALTTVSRRSTCGQAQRHCNCEGCEPKSNLFFLHQSNERLYPAVLHVSRAVYTEALPVLYRNRTFYLDTTAVEFQSLHSKFYQQWWLFDEFLGRLSEIALRNIHAIRIPLLLSEFEVCGCREAYYNIAKKLPNPRSVHLEVCPSSVIQSRRLFNEQDAGHPFRMERLRKYRIGPVMAFARAKLQVIAVNKNDISESSFARTKKKVEEAIMEIIGSYQIKHMERQTKKNCDQIFENLTGNVRLSWEVSAKEPLLGWTR